MICKTCGNEVGNASECPFCGCNPNEEFGVEGIGNTPTQITNNSATDSLQSNAKPNNASQTANANAIPELGMKWFKFMIYFQLWANMVLNIYNGVMVFTGSLYGVDSLEVYNVFPTMKGVDVFFGLLYFGLAAFAVIVRFRLAKFKKGSPLLAHILLCANMGILILYAMVASGATGISFSELISEDIVSIVSLIPLLIWNITYYNKRADLFIE